LTGLVFKGDLNKFLKISDFDWVFPMYVHSHMLPFYAEQYISLIYHFIHLFFMTAIWRILL